MWHFWFSTYSPTELVACPHATVYGSSEELLASELGFDWWCLFNNECFQGVKYMSNNWHFLMVGSCVTTMNIKNVGSCVNNIHFIMWNAWVTADIFLMVGSCVTTMNVKNVDSCVNNIYFVICFLVA